MTKVAPSALTDEELQAKLKTFNSIQIATAGIFTVIILVWILLGYWKTNLPVFVTTVALAIVISASQFASTSGLRGELAKRRGSSGTNDLSDE